MMQVSFSMRAYSIFHGDPHWST